MLIALSGPPGSGTSTVGAGLAERLGYEHVSGGDIFRELASERDLTLAELNELAETDDSIDRDLDRRLRATAADAEELVLESRLAGWMAGEHADLKLWLDASLETRAARIAEREEKSVARAREETELREKSEAQRYADYYDIDFSDLSIYDCVLDSARWEPDAVLDILGTAAETYDPAFDEGQTPLEGVRYEF